MIILRRKSFSNDFNVTGEFRMNGIPLRGRPLRFVDDPYEEANSGEEIEDYNEEDSDSENYEEDDY